MTRLLLVLCLVAAVAACGGTDDADSTAPPSRVVRGWLDAIGGTEPATAGEFVDPVSLAVIVGAENALDPDDMVALIDGGLSAEQSAAYWAAFAGYFAQFAGRPIATLRVGDEQVLDGDLEGYAAVAVKSGDATTEVITVRSEIGWRVDLVGTLGPGFVKLMLDDFLALPNTDAARRVIDVYASSVVPALRVAISRQPDGLFVLDGRSLIAEVTIRQRAG